MSQGFGQPPAELVPIPYVECHHGPRRVLTINITSSNAMVSTGKTPPIVSIDGRQYIVYWGPVSFEIPADRPCHVSVHVEGDYVTQAASTLLSPGRSLTLTYETHYTTGVGTFR
jgi:hypothetical protein